MFYRKKELSISSKGKPKLRFNERGNISVKPSDVLKSSAGKEKLRSYSNSEFVKSIRKKERDMAIGESATE